MTKPIGEDWKDCPICGELSEGNCHCFYYYDKTLAPNYHLPDCGRFIALKNEMKTRD